MQLKGTRIACRNLFFPYLLSFFHLHICLSLNTWLLPSVTAEQWTSFCFYLFLQLALLCIRLNFYLTLPVTDGFSPRIQKSKILYNAIPSEFEETATESEYYFMRITSNFYILLILSLPQVSSSSF